VSIVYLVTKKQSIIFLKKYNTKMKNLIIIGAGKFGREVYSWAKQMRAHGVEWQIKGFLDNRRQILDSFNYNVAILAAPENYIPLLDDLFVCAVGCPQTKKQYCEMLTARGARFVNIIHPTVVMGENVKIGNGVILCPYVVVSCEATVGDFVSVNLHVVLGHDAKIGSYCQINSNVSLGGGAIVQEGVTIGSNSAILPNAIVEKYAVVGAGTVVLRKVNTGQTVFGVPAKPVYVPAITSDMPSSSASKSILQHIPKEH